MKVFTGAWIFDGVNLHDGLALVVEDGLVAGLLPVGSAPDAGRVALDGGILAPGLIDLQVNGGGGVMVDQATTLDTLRHICSTHQRLGSTGILPTLITDTPAATAQVIAAGIAATQAQVPGFLGLHLEGPHLDPRRKGAHDPALIRPMAASDLDRIIAAAGQLPALMVTLAPEAVSLDQITALRRAGVVISLGHSDCSAAEAMAAMAAGASCTTHLFNAMSQMGNRMPGLVGATLAGQGAAGLIADGIHVDACTMRVALAAKTHGIFLVSDCMAFAGSGVTEFTMGGRRILRLNGRLTLEDGTLAGADLTLPDAVRFLVENVTIPAERALAMTTSIPAAVIGLGATHGHLMAGRRADFIHLTDDWCVAGVWHNGQAVV